MSEEKNQGFSIQHEPRPATLFVVVVLGLLLSRFVPSHGPSLIQAVFAPEIWPWRLLMQVVFSGTFSAAALWVILSKAYGPKDEHWAYGMIGTILGFWLNLK